MDNGLVEDLYELITGEAGFLVTLRCENRFDDGLYGRIIHIIRTLADCWRGQEMIPRKALPGLCCLLSELSGGNRFLSEEDALKVEDAGLEVLKVLSGLE